MSVNEAMKELIAASEAVARDVRMPKDGAYVKVSTTLATRLINAVIEIRRAPASGLVGKERTE